MHFPDLQCFKNASQGQGYAPDSLANLHVSPQIPYAGFEGPLHGSKGLREWGWEKVGEGEGKQRRG